jgi:hypothetical protein
MLYLKIINGKRDFLAVDCWNNQEFNSLGQLKYLGYCKSVTLNQNIKKNTMKKICLLFTVLLISLFSNAQDDCQRFRVGDFQNVENGVVTSKIHRNDSIQTEKYGKIKIKLKVIWIDECSYHLQFIEGNKAFWESRPKDQPTYDLIVRITAVNGNTYTQESKFENDSDVIYKSEITKVN